MARVVASAARTTSGNSGALVTPQVNDAGQLSAPRALCLQVATTAASGTTPTLAIAVEWSFDGTTFAPSDPADTLTQITGTANGNLAKSFSVKGLYYRIVWTIGGTTPSFTFSIDDLATI